MKNPHVHERNLGSQGFTLDAKRLLSIIHFGKIVAFIFFLKFFTLICQGGIYLPYTFSVSITSKFQERVRKYSKKIKEVESLLRTSWQSAQAFRRLSDCNAQIV